MSTDSLGFHLIRDPRDAMISGYWSWKSVHKNNTPEIIKTRAIIQNLNLEDGLIEMLDHIPLITSTRDWVFGGYDNILEMRYETLIDDSMSGFREILDFLRISIDDDELAYLIDKHSFVRITGREAGDEDVTSHFRKGISGDWKNYFTDEIKQLFKKRYGDILIRMGYEEDYEW